MINILLLNKCTFVCLWREFSTRMRRTLNGFIVILGRRPPPTTLEEFEHGVFLLRFIGLPSTLIRHENTAFRKRFQRGCIENAAFSFSCRRKTFLKTEFFDNDGVSWSRLSCDSPNWLSKMIGDCCFLKFFLRKHSMHFQNKCSVFKFLRRIVNETSPYILLVISSHLQTSLGLWRKKWLVKGKQKNLNYYRL